MRRSVHWLLSALAVLVALAGCSLDRPLRAPDPQLVQSVSSGIVSRHAPIRVRFARAVEQELARSPFRFTPSLAGTARWVDDRTLEFTPAHPMPAGRRVRASVDLAGLAGFDFSFSVMRPSFTVDLGTMETVEGSDGYELAGTIRTSDREEGAAVERLLSARLGGWSLGRLGFGGRRLAVSWDHGEDGLAHHFTVSGISRGTRPGLLTVSWRGGAIASAASGSRAIGVPASRSFAAIAARPIPDATNAIEVSFSDPLASGQDLGGLVRLAGREDVRVSIIGNLVRLFASSPLRSRETVVVEPGVEDDSGASIAEPVSYEVAVEDQLPQVRFVGSGVVLPTTQGLTVPIETMNLRAVIVEAFQVYGDNMTQFLQVNTLAGRNELNRVGTVVWREVVPLGWTDTQKNTWVRHGLDLTPLIGNHPDGMFQLRVSFRIPHIVWPGAESDPSVATPAAGTDWSTLPLVRDAPTDENWLDEYDPGYSEDYWEHRLDPTHPGYYVSWYDDNRGVLAIRNVLVSNIALMARGDMSGRYSVVATDLRSARPLAGVALELQSFQGRKLATATTDASGVASFLSTEPSPFVVASLGDQHGWLKCDSGSLLPVSHFDTGGEIVRQGVKGFIYGERGVWRPADPIYLTFVLYDPQNAVPADHPVTLELRDPRGQLVERLTRTDPVDGFYSFATSTAADALTGNWEARVKVGDRIFAKTLKVETVMPNRLKMSLELPPLISSGAFRAPLAASWLTGAAADSLRATVTLRLGEKATTFAKYPQFVFDDPTRAVSGGETDLFDGKLGKDGTAVLSTSIDVEGAAPGKLDASFLVRVFEPSGVFSSEVFSGELSPYRQYVGLQVPKATGWGGMLAADTEHTVRIAMVDERGNPVKSATVRAELYQLDWQWWWEWGEQTLPEFAASSAFDPMTSGTVAISNGEGTWAFKVDSPEWGRFLVRVVDPSGGHSAGSVIYIDWPWWQSSASTDKLGATMLTLATDKERYTVGDKVTVTFPSNAQGRALAVIEQAGRMTRQEWVAGADGTTKWQFTASADMAPNCYVHVSFIQPHQQTANDLPIRLYGVVPVFVDDPGSHLSPVVESADAFRPGETVSVSVREAAGKEMTYTLAVVDEGLLRLTGYQAPDPWQTFFKREGSVLRSWDLFDLVAGAYAGKLENLLAIGGGEDLLAGGERKASRFPPVVRFVGPVALARGATNTHRIELPQYIGSVRLMVVAGHEGAWGAAQREVPVRSEVMVLPTLPRVLSTGEMVELPVSVFTSVDNVRTVTVSVSVSGPAALVSSASQNVSFTKADEKIVRFQLAAGKSVGVAKVHVVAVAGAFRAESDTEVDVRVPVSRQTSTIAATVQPGRTWREEVKMPGLAGTNTVRLELSRVPPLDLGRNLDWLIHYPYGCIEQTTSSVFPQLYLDRLVKLSKEQAEETQRNITAGVQRLKSFQAPDGGFRYWPGYGPSDQWGSTYAGHFMVEAKQRGVEVPAAMLASWVEYQRAKAESWVNGDDDRLSPLNQAYRLYGLALAGEPSLGAMNRLRELKVLSTPERWLLAAAYQLAGQRAEATRLTSGLGFTVATYRALSGTYGSDLRDRSMILVGMADLGMLERAQGLAEDVSRALSSSDPWSTQTTAWALLGLARYALGRPGDSSTLSLEYRWGDGKLVDIDTDKPILVEDLPVASATQGTLLISNTGKTPLYPRVILSGLPEPGQETAASNGLSLDVVYRDDKGKTIDPVDVTAGSDVTIDVTVTNRRNAYLEQLALAFLLPGGWEATNTRMTGGSETGEGEQAFDYQDIRDDRIYTFFSLGERQRKTFTFHATATYNGTFYLPPVSVEAMYDPTINARVPGKWLDRVRRRLF